MSKWKCDSWHHYEAFASFCGRLDAINFGLEVICWFNICVHILFLMHIILLIIMNTF